MNLNDIILLIITHLYMNQKRVLSLTYNKKNNIFLRNTQLI